MRCLLPTISPPTRLLLGDYFTVDRRLPRPFRVPALSSVSAPLLLGGLAALRARLAIDKQYPRSAQLRGIAPS